MSDLESLNLDALPETPSFWKRHADTVASVAVFLSTVLLTVICFPPYDSAEFAYVFAAPAIVWAYRKPSFKRFAWTLLSAQAVSWGILLFWLHHVTWAGPLLLAPFVGVWIGLWYLAVWWSMPRLFLKPTAVRVIGLLALAGLWVVIEWTRHWFLTGFPWLPLAASQWKRTMVIQIASYTGSAGISFILISFNLGFAAYAHRLFFEKLRGLKKRSPEFMFAMVVLMFMAFLPIRDVVGQKREFLARVAVMQPNIPQEVKWDPERAPGILQAIEETTDAAAELHPEFIVWPESVMPMLVQRSETARRWIEGMSNRLKMPILFGADAVAPGANGIDDWYNAAFVVEPEKGLQPDFYSKRHLVPFGEYVPMRPLLGWLNKFVPIGDGDFQAGKSPAPLVVGSKLNPVVVGPLICYEDLFPDMARDSVLAGASMLVVITNDAWYGEGAAAYQHAAHSVLRAVETRRPVLRCGNAGWSGWIDEYGNIRGVALNNEQSVYFRGARAFTMTRDGRWTGQQSLYLQHGDWFIGVSAGLVLFGLLVLRFAPDEERETDEEPSAS